MKYIIEIMVIDFLAIFSLFNSKSHTCYMVAYFDYLPREKTYGSAKKADAGRDDG